MRTAPDLINDDQGQTLFPFHCRGCGQVMGWGTGPLGVRVYCSASCAGDGPLGENEERNDLIRNVVAAGWTTAKTGEVFGISRQRVNQMLYRPTLDEPKEPPGRRLAKQEAKKAVAYNRRAAKKKGAA